MTTTLFEKNLAVIEKFQPNLALQLKNMENSGVTLVEKDEGTNLDIGHVDLYDGGAENYTDKQFEAYLENPQRVLLGWPAPIDDNTLRAQRFRTELRDIYIEKGITSGTADLDKTAAFSVVLGLGLGFHIDKIFNEFGVRSIYIAEQYIDFLYHTMHIQNVGDWYEEADRRNGQLFILIGDEANMLTSALFNQVKFKDFGLADGVYFYEHYDSFFLKQVRELFLERLPVFSANPGFFEDEMVMMNNCFQNITENKFWDFTDSHRFSKDTPVLIAGSGPSLDSSIEFIRENRAEIVVVTAGSGLGSLLSYDLTPDFHVETENTEGPPKFIGELAEEYDLSEIILISPNTVHPKVPTFFKRTILFFRDAVTATKFFGVNSQEIFQAAPVVTNAAVRISIGLGFKNIYLAGVDLGARDKEKHHSKKSMYHRDGFFDEHPAHKVASTFEIEVPGNFGGTVLTNQSFLNAAMYFSSFKGTFPATTIYNLSDGVRILGAIPKLPETLKIEQDSRYRDREIRQIIDTHDREARVMKVFPAELQNLRDALQGFYKQLREAVDATNDETPDIMEFYDAIKPVVYMDRDSSHVLRTVHQYNVGTVMMYFQSAYQMFKRLAEDDKPEFYVIFKEKFHQYLDDMEEEVLQQINGLIAKTS